MPSVEKSSSPPVPEVDHLPSPLIINWSLSYKCNFNCSHCYTRLDKSPELDTEEIMEIAKRLAGAGVMFINFGGGEPLLRSDLYEIARNASGLKLKVSMNSNGYLIGKNDALKLKEAGFSNIGISIDSHDPVLHDQFRNKQGSHAKAVEAVKNLKEAGLTVTISSVICKINHLKLEPLLDMVNQLGASQLFLHNFKCSGKGLDNRFELDLQPSEWKEFYIKALSIVKDNPTVPISFDDPIINSLDGRAEPGSIRGSTCGKISLNIRPNGDITPCGFIPEVIGNVLEDDLLSIWENNPFLYKMRNKTPHGKCLSCPSFVDCLGGCTARAYSITGDLEEPDPHCWR